MRTVKCRTTFLIALQSYLPKDCIGCELGTYQGDFAKQILDIIKPSVLYLVDPYEIGQALYGDEHSLPKAYSTQDDFDKLCERFKGEISTGQITIFRDYSYNAVKSCPDGFLDFLYHDASHLYEDLKRDMNDWLPKMKQGSVICGHDYKEISNFGVIEAVDEFIKEHDFEMIIFNEAGGDFALKKRI